MAESVAPERKFCDAARAYLLEFAEYGVTPEVLNRYLDLSENPRVFKLGDVYWQLLWSSQNANMRTAVVTGSMDGGMMALADVLLGFEPAKVVARYAGDSNAVLEEIVNRVKPRGQIRRSCRSVWPRFCRSVVSGAEFLNQFSDASEFYAWADGFAASGRSSSVLPDAISGQVEGIGFALACDFLKELGYANYGKPDVHIRKVLIGLGLMTESTSDPVAHELLQSFAQSAGLQPYQVDKLIWLVGSGSFYRHREIGRVPTDRDAFVDRQRHLFRRV